MSTSDPAADPSTTRRPRLWWVAGAVAAVAVVAVLAFGVFGVHTLFIDETVDEAGPTFRSGAAETAPPTTAASTPGTEAGPSAPSEPVARVEAPATTTAVPQVETVAQGSFEGNDHPGSGTATVLTDGAQTFVRFEDDFSTDNGPDLFAVVYVAGERIELGSLKGNRGAQNYEVPPEIDPGSIEAVAVWCKRFDSTFTTAQLAAP